MVTKKEKTDGWMNVRIKATTLKRLRLLKAQQEVPLYDDVINTGLDLIEEEMK